MVLNWAESATGPRKVFEGRVSETLGDDFEGFFEGGNELGGDGFVDVETACS